MKEQEKEFRRLKHRKRYILTIILAGIWMLFFDKNSMIERIKLSREYEQLSSQKKFYIQEINMMNTEMEDLETNNVKLEKLARERYLMKKDNEDIFLIMRTEKED